MIFFKDLVNVLDIFMSLQKCLSCGQSFVVMGSVPEALR